MSHRSLVAAAALLLVGCSARSQVRNAPPGAGLVHSYASPFDQVQRAVRTVLEDVSLSVSEERWLDRRLWSVLATPGAGAAMGRIVRVVVEDHPTDCRVWVLAQIKSDVIEEQLQENLQGRIAKQLGAASPERPSPDAAGEKEERYRAPLARCGELTSKACRDLGFVVVREDRGDAALQTITAEKKGSRRLFAALYRQSPEVTRVVVEVRGGAAEENRDDASAVHQELRKELPVER
jgi:hypothetical protein